MGFLPSNYAIRNTLDTESVIIRTFVNGKSYSIEILVRINSPRNKLEYEGL